MHYFSSKNNSIAGKGRYWTGRGVLVFEAGLGICSWPKKTENIHVLFIFLPNNSETAPDYHKHNHGPPANNQIHILTYLPEKLKNSTHSVCVCIAVP